MIEIGFEFTAMSCPCEIRVVGADEQQVHGAAQAGIDEVRRIEQKYSRYRPDSLLSRINAAAGHDPVQIDQETHALLQLGGHLHRASGGRFDLTSGVLRRAWDFRTQRVPTQAQIDALLPLVGWGRVVMTPEHVRLPQRGMELDLGGLGKEYAADRAADMCLALGMHGGFVDLGGDIRVIGPRADGSGWRFGIRDPLNAGSLNGELTLTSGALATSGDYERGFEADGKRYGHLLDARSGWPVDHWRSVSVAAPTAVAAGMLATLGMLMGEQTQRLLAQESVWSLVVGTDGAFTGAGYSNSTRGLGYEP
jgi:thiamine biosynthesis lipoprotein